ncbi:MAG TPA: hypothetical protein DDW71_06855 [Lactobacillus sp.]|jgi:hypothetical protein|uniref:Uncharacterized protein n=1 Tax=Secundilactobacillus silagincola TaxID=1714681 RepID=A0A1Z5H5K1_9LACO|nr:hypothetical protein [Secundilactobacillus silagincola]GAT18274.1 hypothetical protein IWT5_00547 [Secundilactobacillus silagincola]HBF74960.1 hypothetical protein [Lactobacillus sp.]
MQETTKDLSSTITKAYHHNWVIKLTLSQSKAVTGMVNTSPSDGVFYLTHDGDIERFELEDLNNVTVIEKNWWKI